MNRLYICSYIKSSDLRTKIKAGILASCYLVGLFMTRIALSLTLIVIIYRNGV